MADELLTRVGRNVRQQRELLAITRKALSAACGVSERFLAQLESGEGNISLLKFSAVATALGIAPERLLAADPDAKANTDIRHIALLGMRGAGKSTIGPLLAASTGHQFWEVDREIEKRAGLSLSEIFELHGEAYYRQVEREVLLDILRGRPAVLATGGSIVSDDTNFELVQSRCRTVWLTASPKEHWNRVLAQGDHRPMRNNPHAFSELERLLTARRSSYARAELTISTSKKTPEAVAQQLVRTLDA